MHETTGRGRFARFTAPLQQDWLPAGALLLTLALAGCQSQGTTSPGEDQIPPEVPTETAAQPETASPPMGFALASTTTVTPWRDENFSRYTSDANWRSDPFDYMVTNISDWAIHLDRSVTYDGHQSLRYDWPGASPTNTMCNSQLTREANYKLPNVREFWVEVVHKFATTFNTNDKKNGGYCGVSEYKFLLVRLSGVPYRFDMKNGKNGSQWWNAHPQQNNETFSATCSGIGWDCRFGYGTGQSAYASSVPGPLWDNQWHVYRVHIKLPASKGQNTGIAEYWIDGKLIKRVTNKTFISPSGAFSNVPIQLSLGGNSNSGMSRSTSEWWGRVRIWTSNPGF
jgi:hypothetical protein